MRDVRKASKRGTVPTSMGRRRFECSFFRTASPQPEADDERGLAVRGGGAGGIEAVFTALALRDQFAPPTIHYEQPDPECDLDYVPNAGRAQAMTYALSNSLGFGGHNACIALRRWEG